jgi:hypothetical protein
VAEIDAAAEQAAAHVAPDGSPAVVDSIALARLYGEPLFKLPTDLYIPPDALEVFLEAFQGPLDLLLYLIRRQNFNIFDIPLAIISTQSYGGEGGTVRGHIRVAEHLTMTTARLGTRILLVAVREDVDLAGDVEVVRLGAQAGLEHRGAGFGERTRAVQHQRDAAKAQVERGGLEAEMARLAGGAVAAPQGRWVVAEIEAGAGADAVRDAADRLRGELKRGAALLAAFDADRRRTARVPAWAEALAAAVAPAQ